MVSERLRVAVKSAHVRQYQLAQQIGAHPTVLSAWLNGISHPKLDDPRVIALGALVRVPADECFAKRGEESRGVA